MAKRKRGLICTISSWGGLSYIFGAAYGAGKSGCDRLAADMAVDLKKDNITSISLWPGIVGTEHIFQMAQEDEHDNFADGYNWETPLLTGRVIAALTNDKNIINYTGKVKIVAELAERYKICDRDGNKPVSLRSLRFLIPLAIPQLRQKSGLIPNIKIPWFLLLWFALKSPQL